MSNRDTENQTEQIEKYAAVFKALSSPHRLRILLELASCPVGDGSFSGSADEMMNCQQDFARELGLAPSTVSHHFKELRQAGLLFMRREGKTLTVTVNHAVLAEVRDLF